MASDVTVDLQKIVAGLRRKHSEQLDAAVYEGVVLATAVDQLQERVTQLEQQLAQVRNGMPGA